MNLRSRSWILSLTLLGCSSQEPIADPSNELNEPIDPIDPIDGAAWVDPLIGTAGGRLETP